MQIGELKRVSLRDVWRHEAYDFTSWLQDHLDVLNDQLGFDLVAAEREQAAGPFSIDLVAEDSAGYVVIIENQLEKTDHDHLGKLLTYMVAIDARAAIWIVAEPRPEHLAVISWLNESSSGDFYLIKVEAIRIDDSPAAPLFTSIVFPSIEARQIGQTKKELAERHQLRRELLGHVPHPVERTNQDLRRKFYNGQYLALEVGWSTKSRLGLHHQSNEARVMLNVDSPDPVWNREVVTSLEQHREAIESECACQLTWDIVEGRRRCGIVQELPDGGYSSGTEEWSVIQERMIDALICLEKALRPYLSEIR